MPLGRRETDGKGSLAANVKRVSDCLFDVCYEGFRFRYRVPRVKLNLTADSVCVMALLADL
jgi:hypothetical protein